MGSFKYGPKGQGRPRTSLKHCGHSAVACDVLNTQCRYAGEQHFLALFANKMPLKGEAETRKRGERKRHLKQNMVLSSASLWIKKGLFQSCSGEARNERETRKRREKPHGVLAPQEEANSDSPKAFLPANLLPVPDCCQTGAPAAGKLTSSV